ncbi:TetR/AcrR family transcriptional regulator [Nocardioides ferulae]|uniref:TetR/AcrR family transcriptional regulator n=1 Tax=Nocardioides ferulae TaxID=2340821 RepID=UPI000EB28356|nr:TetR/AcrR family transcriptional regulator [Nocardioides ferulae]
MPGSRAADQAGRRIAILHAAEARLRDGGPAALSVAAIARELGVAQNTVYWYFPSRAHLLVAALERLLAAELAEPPPADLPPVPRLLWTTDRLASLWPMFGFLYENAGRSEVVADCLARIDEVLTDRFTDAFREQVPAREVGAAVAVFRATVDGAFARGLDASTRRLVLRYAAARLTRDPGRASERGPGR